jgi:hypothetical protein
MFCSNCGANAGDAGFCPRCGSAMSAGVPAASPWQAPPPPEPPRRSLLPTALAGAGVGLVIVLLATIAFILHSQVGGSDPVAAAATTRAASPTSRAPAATVTTTVSSRPHKHHHRAPVHSTAPTAPSYAGPGDVRGLAAGLFCRDLYARGFSYSAAVDYWRMHGQPNQMDIDRNGIPCETVYPPSDVSDYWGFTSLPDTSALPAGLFCRDLYARGYSYADAVSYWYLHGEPDQMDIDLNGIPCETVYPPSDVDNYWY